jgi:hypothetical protein
MGHPTSTPPLKITYLPGLLVVGGLVQRSLALAGDSDDLAAELTG